MEIFQSSETFIKRDQRVILATIVLMALAGWVFLFYEAWGMEHMGKAVSVCCMISFKHWTAQDLWLLFVMWDVMMVAMMLPSVAPMALVFASVNRKRKDNVDAVVPTWIFLSGYLLVWTAFSVLAALLQWLLHSQALLNPMMVSTSPFFGGFLLILAGLFQFTPFKNACLNHCRTPFDFIMTEWREGRWGTFVMGLRHGLYCTGCCWVLMALLFVLGVMNIWWIAAISIFVLLEKVIPKRFLFSQVSGVLLLMWGLILILEFSKPSL